MLKAGYFIAGSLHYLPTVLPLIAETGGKIITFRRIPGRYFSTCENKNFEVVKFTGYGALLRNFSKLDLNVLVHPSFSVHHFKDFKRVVHVQIFHGTSDKPFNFHRSLAKYDLIVVPGKKMKDDIIKRKLASSEKIVIIGYPKLDSFLHSDFDEDKFRDELSIDSGRKTILYSPTWDDPDHYSSFNKYIGVILSQLDRYNVIVKPHPNILKYRPWQILKAYLLKKKNARIYPGKMNIIPLMKISDIMLTDISSVSHEYLIFNRPMVFLAPRNVESIPESHRWIWRCGDVVENPEELPEIVEKNLESSDIYLEERKKALNYIFHEFDGKSSIRFKNALLNLVKQRGMQF